MDRGIEKRRRIPSPDPSCEGRGALHLCRLGPLPLNREAQVGSGAAYQASRYEADLHTYADDRTPWVRLTRIKGLPGPLLEHRRERPNCKFMLLEKIIPQPARFC